MSKIAFRVDGGSSIGLGHIMRSIVLAKELQKSNEIIFICRENRLDKAKYKAGINKVRLEGFRVVQIKENNIINQLREINLLENIDCLITDSYDVNENYFDDIKSIFKYTGYIDDVNICRLNVDFIINQNINAIELNYNTYPSKNTKLFLGTQYCLLREEFRGFKERVINDNVRDILVTVGGMDKEFNTLKIIKLIKECNCNIHIAIGGAFEKKLIESLLEIANSSSNILLYRNANMSELMKRCDMAISACGSTLYELAAMQVPTIGIVIADNQEYIAKHLSEKKVIINTEDLLNLNGQQFVKIIEYLINNKEKRVQMIKLQKELVNVDGARKLSSEINDIID